MEHNLGGLVMILVAEKINSTNKIIRAAVVDRDVEFISNLCRRQADAGADYIDVNAGNIYNGEAESLQWLVKVAQEAVEKPLAIDSADPVALEGALKLHNGKALVNSISGEKKRYNAVLPLVKEHKSSIVVLCNDDRGIPKNPETKIAIGSKVVENLLQEGIPVEDIFVDPLLQPLSVNLNSVVDMFTVTKEITSRFPGIHVICGLSNVSFGLPARSCINSAFLPMAVYAGMDSAVLDVLDKKLMAQNMAAQTLLGRDKFCKNYLKAFRAGILKN